jgi:pimeloyl-ACP methyl ester carboxylesterase
MKHITWGDGPKTLLFIQGGPGSHVPRGRLALASTQRMFAPYLAAGYRVTMTTRRRHMPSGYTFTDMADDHARLITEVLGGRADLVVAESYGGMIAQYLAALHPERLDHLALIATGCRLSPWSDDLDARLIAALEADDLRAAAAVFAEELLPGRSLRLLRRMSAPLLARRMVPVDDVLTETRADLTYDPRPLLPGIQAPTLLVYGDRDRFFTTQIVEETAALIPGCQLVRRKGKGHIATVSSRRNPRDVLAFVSGRGDGTRSAEPVQDVE